MLWIEMEVMYFIYCEKMYKQNNLHIVHLIFTPCFFQGLYHLHETGKMHRDIKVISFFKALSSYDHTLLNCELSREHKRRPVHVCRLFREPTSF